MNQAGFTVRAQVSAAELREAAIIVLDEQLPDVEPKLVIPTAVEDRIAKGIECGSLLAHHFDTLNLQKSGTTSLASPIRHLSIGQSSSISEGHQSCRSLRQFREGPASCRWRSGRSLDDRAESRSSPSTGPSGHSSRRGS